MHHLANQVSKFHETIVLPPTQVRNSPFSDPRFDFLSITLLRKLRATKPDVIHYVPSSGLTPASLIRARTLAKYAGTPKLVISCLQLSSKHFFRKITSAIKPDLVLVQSHKTADTLTRLGLETKPLPNGVDISKFCPASSDAKSSLRKKFGLGNEFIILHVGHIKDGRGLEALHNLSNKGAKLILVGSTSTRLDKRVARELVESGGVIWRDYFSNIEEIYNLADCYVFPTLNPSACIEIPLSVLEAMSCNLPVVSTGFGGLPEIFEQGDGLFFAANEGEILNAIGALRSTDGAVKTRQKVIPYSWERVGETLSAIYNELEGPN